MQLDPHSVTSLCGQYTRTVWYLPPDDPQARQICIFLDGEYYVHRMDAPAMLAELQKSGTIPPVACLFVSHLSGEARHFDYACSAKYARFVARDLVGWVQRRSKITAAGGHLIGGTSLGGLEAAYTSLRHPTVFAHALCQSGSFWWSREWLKGNLKKLTPRGGKFWLSVGREEIGFGTAHPPTGLLQEVDQISAVRNFAEAVEREGATAHYHLYEGGHEIPPWKEEFPKAMQWLLEPASPVE